MSILSYLRSDSFRLRAALLFGVLLLVGLVISKAAMSIGMFGLLGAALLGADKKENWRRFYQNRAYIGICGIFICLLLSGFRSENWEMLGGQLRIALPLLALPISFGLLPPLTKAIFYSWLYILILIMSIASLGVLIHYALHFEAIQQRIIVSQAIPTPSGDHIRFSLLVCLAFFAATYLRSEGYHWRWAWEKHLQVILAIFLFITLHILSVRSGLLGLYIGIFVLLMQFIFIQRRFLLGSALLLTLFALPFVAYYTVPSFKIKYHLMSHNLHLFRSGEIGEYSDTQRLLSYYVAWEVSKNSPWLGVGMGDVRDEQDRYYAKHYPHIKSKYPHNQFLLWYLGMGIVGAVLCVFCFFLPIAYRGYARNSFFLAFFVLIFSSFLTENTLSIAIGMAIYSFFVCANIAYLEGARGDRKAAAIATGA